MFVWSFESGFRWFGYDVIVELLSLDLLGVILFSFLRWFFWYPFFEIGWIFVVEINQRSFLLLLLLSSAPWGFSLWYIKARVIPRCSQSVSSQRYKKVLIWGKYFFRNPFYQLVSVVELLYIQDSVVLCYVLSRFLISLFFFLFSSYHFRIPLSCLWPAGRCPLFRRRDRAILFPC